MALVKIMQARIAAGQLIGRRHHHSPVSCKVDIADFAGLTCCGDHRRVPPRRRRPARRGLQIGDVIRIGERTRGEVVRLIDGGVGVQFLQIIPIEEFDERVRL